MFDRIVVVDWSAHSSPKRGKDSIWIAHFDNDDPNGRSANVATRRAAVDRIEDLVSSGRTLLAVDFSLGYPRGTSAALGLDGSAWQSMWSLLDELVVDDSKNVNNRFDVAAELNRRSGALPGPFWGRPHTQQIDGLTSTKVPCHPLPEWRHVEQSLRDGGLRPFSSWQLLGAGAVGSQSMLGIAALARLRRRLTELHGVNVDVWPFTTGMTTPTIASDACVIVEIWPSMVEVVDAGRVHDEAQVLTIGAHLRAGDTNGALASWFAPELPDEQRHVVAGEEGWVLGAGTDLVRQ